MTTKTTRRGPYLKRNLADREAIHLEQTRIYRLARKGVLPAETARDLVLQLSLIRLGLEDERP